MLRQETKCFRIPLHKKFQRPGWKKNIPTESNFPFTKSFSLYYRSFALKNISKHFYLACQPLECSTMRGSIFAGAFGILAFLSCTPSCNYHEGLTSSELTVRRATAESLAGTDKPCLSARHDLLKSLYDDDPSVREFSIRALAKFGTSHSDIVNAVRLSLNDPDLNVRRAAASTLCFLNPLPSDILDALTGSLCDPDSTLRSYVVATFTDLGTEGITVLERTLRSGKPELRCSAAKLLGRMGSDARRALPALKALLNDKDDMVRNSARSAIDAIQTTTAD